MKTVMLPIRSDVNPIIRYPAGLDGREVRIKREPVDAPPARVLPEELNLSKPRVRVQERRTS